MGVSRKLFLALAVAAAATGFAGLAGAAEPLPWQMNLQPAVTPVGEEARRFHDILLVIIAAISVFVLGLMIYCFIRFNEKANPVPSRTSHNTLVEVLGCTLDELQPALKALLVNDFEVVSIHNHMTHEDRRMLFIHFWRIAPAEQLMKGLDSALRAAGH